MDGRGTGSEERVAEERLLVASGFAEGRSGQGILSPTLVAPLAEHAGELSPDEMQRLSRGRE
jgi:hypothetical protein